MPRIGLGVGLGAGPATIRQGWSPLDLGPALLGYWDTERPDSMTIQANGTISNWRDIATGSLGSQPVGSLRPVWNDTIIAGKRPGAVFDGVDDYLQGDAANMPLGAQPSELWALATDTSDPAETGQRGLFTTGDPTNRGRSIRRATGAGNVPVGWVGDGTAPISVNTTLSAAGLHTWRFQINPTQQAMYLDGVLGGTNNIVTNSAATIFRLGAVNSALVWKGAVNAIIMTAGLTTDQAAQLFAFLEARRLS